MLWFVCLTATASTWIGTCGGMVVAFFSGCRAHWDWLVVGVVVVTDVVVCVVVCLPRCDEQSTMLDNPKGYNFSDKDRIPQPKHTIQYGHTATDNKD